MSNNINSDPLGDTAMCPFAVHGYREDFFEDNVVANLVDNDLLKCLHNKDLWYVRHGGI